MPAIPEPSGQVAIYVSGSDCSPERLVSSDELGWLYVGLGSIAGLREQRLTGSPIHKTGLPETGHSSPAPYAAELPAVSGGPLDQRVESAKHFCL